MKCDGFSFDTMKLASCSFVLALCLHLIRSQLLSFPKNEIAKIGQRVEFECSTNATLPLRWNFARVNSSLIEKIYLNEEITDEFKSRGCSVDISMKGRWTLVIKSVKVDHAGTYSCQNTPDYDKGRNVMSAAAQLIITDSVPHCTTNASNSGIEAGDYIKMWCTFIYNGNWIPSMQCSRKDGETALADVDWADGSSEVTLSLITQMTSSDNGVAFSCKITLNSNTTINKTANISETMASNIPFYQELWNYKANVLYGPMTPTISLIDDLLQVGRRVECVADGNPTPTYEWIIVGKNLTLSNDAILVINESMVSDKEQTLQCTATNFVSGQKRSNSTAFTFNLTDPSLYIPGITTQPIGSYQQNLIIGSSVVALVLCLAICLAVIIGKSKMRRREFRVAKTAEAPAQPIYAMVNKERNGDVAKKTVLPTNHLQQNKDGPIYTEVHKQGNDKKKTGSTFRISTPTESKTKQNYTGADGTQYAELSSLTDPRLNGVPVQRNPTFGLVDTYASIDHTLEVPPPPLPKRH